MFLIALSWIYIAFTALIFGIIYQKLLKFKDCHVAIQLILGLFLYTVTTTIIALFYRIHIEYYIIIFLLNCVLAYVFRLKIKEFYKTSLSGYKRLKSTFKGIFILLFFVVLAQSATRPYLLDNESYYIQTIKWVNEFGFVKGLANLHLFLGQNSSWHTLQAGFNFPFLANFFNDINGFVYIVLGFLYVEKFNNSSTKQDYFLGMILAGSLFFIQFVNAPSPDLLIFLLTPYVVYEFIQHFNTISRNQFIILLSLVLYLCFVKVTIAVLVFLMLILFVKHFKYLKLDLVKYILIGITILGLFLVKNYTISGYLFYPTTVLDFLDVDWKLPKQLLQLYAPGTLQSGTTMIDVSQLNVFEKFKHWLQIPKLPGLFNKLYTMLFLVFPLLFLKKKIRIPLMIIYGIAVLQFIILWFHTPHYRFYFVFILILALQLFIRIISVRKLGLLFVYASLVFSAIPIFFPLQIDAITSNTYAKTLSNFKFINIVIPEENTRTITTFTKEQVEGFEFYSPGEDVFFWSTGNGELPCVNKQQVEYIKKYYHIIPELRGPSLKDGFKSKMIRID